VFGKLPNLSNEVVAVDFCVAQIFVMRRRYERSTVIRPSCRYKLEAGSRYLRSSTTSLAGARTAFAGHGDLNPGENSSVVDPSRMMSRRYQAVVACTNDIRVTLIVFVMSATSGRLVVNIVMA